MVSKIHWRAVRVWHEDGQEIERGTRAHHERMHEYAKTGGIASHYVTHAGPDASGWPGPEFTQINWADIETAHTHHAILTAERASSGPVSRDENPMAHGNITIVETCECGMQRKTNVNGQHIERGYWEGETHAARRNREEAELAARVAAAPYIAWVRYLDGAVVRAVTEEEYAAALSASPDDRMVIDGEEVHLDVVPLAAKRVYSAPAPVLRAPEAKLTPSP